MTEDGQSSMKERKFILVEFDEDGWSRQIPMRDREIRQVFKGRLDWQNFSANHKATPWIVGLYRAAFHQNDK